MTTAVLDNLYGIKQADHTGVMLALYPPLDDAYSFAIPEGEQADELHVTLLYFGDVDDFTEDTLKRIEREAAKVAARFAPVEAELGGIGRFYTTDEDGNQAFYASVDSPTLPKLRAELADRLSGLFKDNHGFTPHMTLAYVKDDDANPLDSWIPTNVRFGDLHLVIAGEQTLLPFAGGEKALRIEADVTEDDAFWNAMMARFDKTVRASFQDIFIAGAESVSMREPGTKAMPAVLLPVEVDLELLAEQAIKNYTSPFYQAIALSTRTRLKNAILRSRQEGLGVEYVLKVAGHLFGKERARTIAITETTRLFGLGAQAAYEASGVQEWQWNSVNDFKVDPICAAKNGTRFSIGVPFEPAHTRCRCFPVPVEGELLAEAAASLLDSSKTADYDLKRPPASQRGYGTRWKKESADFLKAHPDCINCGGLAIVVDHSHRRKHTDPDFWDKRNWRSLCKSCHSSKTDSIDGGFGNPAKELTSSDKHLPGQHDQARHGVGSLAGTGPTGERAYTYLRKNYPADTVEWAKGANWTYSTSVPLSKIDMGRRPGGARDPKRVEGITEAVRAGKVKLSPVVLVEKSNGRFALADGYHRTKVFEKLGRDTVNAYVAHGVGDHGPWDKAMHLGKLNKERSEGFDLGVLLADFRMKHLPGKHNQQAHAGAPSVTPGSDQEKAMFGDLNNFSKIRASGNQQQLVDVVRYTGTSKEINGHLRGTVQLSAERLPEVKRQIGSMDMAIKGSPLKRNVTLYRGIKPEIIGRAKIGDKLHDPGFMSTSTNRKRSVDNLSGIMESRSGGGGLVEIKAFKGLPAFGADGSEGEVILPRGSTLRITGIRSERMPGAHIRVLQAEVISAGL